MKFWYFAFLATILIGLTGCALDQRKDNMDAALRGYERSIRWGSYSDAQLTLETPNSQEFLDQYKDIRVISYEIKSREVIGEFEQLNQVVDIKFYHEQQGVIKTLRDRQVWIHDQERDVWLLQSGLPDFQSVFH